MTGISWEITRHSTTYAKSRKLQFCRPQINYPIPTLHPDSCFQWIVAWYSWYLPAVSNRIGFQIRRHGIPSRLLDSNHTSGRESKTSTKGSAWNSPPSLGMHAWLPSVVIPIFKIDVLLARFSTDLGFTYLIVTLPELFTAGLFSGIEKLFHLACRFSRISCFLALNSSGYFSGQESLQVFQWPLRHRYACDVRIAQKSALQGLI